jgi:hypothetical protein
MFTHFGFRRRPCDRCYWFSTSDALIVESEVHLEVLKIAPLSSSLLRVRFWSVRIGNRELQGISRSTAMTLKYNVICQYSFDILRNRFTVADKTTLYFTTISFRGSSIIKRTVQSNSSNYPWENHLVQNKQAFIHFNLACRENRMR